MPESRPPVVGRGRRVRLPTVLAAVVAVAVAVVVLARVVGGADGRGAAEPETVPPAPSTAPQPQGRCPVAPAYRSELTMFGVSVSTRTLSLEDSLATAERTFGRLPVVRTFDPGLPPPGAWERRKPILAGRAVVTSFRPPPAEVLSGRHDAALLAYFKEAPRNSPVFWSYFHEPESHIDEGSFSHEEFRLAFRHIAELAATLCRDDLYPTLVLTGYTVDPESRRDWLDYYPGADSVSVLAWDPYNSASRRPTEYPPPGEVYSRVIEASRSAGKPFAIAETGSQLIPGDDGRLRAVWLHEVGRYLMAEGAVFVTWFNSVGVSGADYRLRDPHSAAAWSAWVARR